MSRPGSRLRCCAGVLLLLTCLYAFGQFEDPETTLARGDTALGQGRFDVAQSIYQGVLNANPNLKLSSWRCRNIAEANIRATHPNLRAGADWLQRAVDLAPNDVSNRERLATVLLQTGATDGAAAQYRFLIGKSPDNPEYILGLAAALRESGQYQAGASLLSATLQNQPNDPSLRVEYARNLLYQRQFSAAIEQYNQVLRWYPNDIDALVGLGKTYSWQGNQQLALEQYQKALVADPGNYDALVAQGFSLIWSGRQNEALPMLERANSRHPEVAEVRDALKRLGAVNVFTGDVSAGPPEWPILSPTMKKLPEPKRGKDSTAWIPPSPEPAGGAADSSAPRGPSSAPPPASGPQQGRSMLWVVGMGLTVMVSVFIVVAFFLFYLPTLRNKKAGKTAVAARVAEAKPQPNPVEQWARLEEFSRTSKVERPPKSYRPVAPAPKTAPLSLSELLPPPKPSGPEIEPGPEATIPTSTGSAAPAVAPNSPGPALHATAAPVEAAPDVAAPKPPRRRRGAAPADKPWWRDLSNPDLAKPAQPAEPEIANIAAIPPEAPARPRSPFLDVPDDVVMPSNAPNPLTPASERPSLPEEPPPARPFTQVLSRALERAGDGQAAEPQEPFKPEETDEWEEAEYMPNGNGSGRAHAAAPAPAFEPAPPISHALNEASVVIVGCGVMVSHYRGILKSAGADVRAFTFWDLAMSSMRKRRADVLLIDGDALDGFTPAQMYTSAQVERYMFGSVLVGISSDEDRTSLPDDVVLSHSLADDELRQRFAESLQAS